MESRKVADLNNEELLAEIDILDIQIDAQARIMSNYKFRQKECINELKKRMREEL